MKCKIEKYIYRKSADLFLKGFIIGEDEIVRLIKLLNTTHIMLLFENSMKDDEIARLFDEYNIRQYAFLDISHRSVLAQVPLEYFKAFFCTIMQNSVSDVLLFNLLDDSQWMSCCKRGNQLSPRFLVKNKISGMTIEIDFYENYAGLYFSLDCYNAYDVIEFIKNYI